MLNKIINIYHHSEKGLMYHKPGEDVKPLTQNDAIAIYLALLEMLNNQDAN